MKERSIWFYITLQIICVIGIITIGILSGCKQAAAPEPENPEAQNTQSQSVTTGTLSGKITLDNSLEGNAGFSVFIGGTTYMAKTGRSGKFAITDVPAGTDYEIYIEKANYTILWKTVAVTAGQETQLGTLNITSTQLQTDTDDDGSSANGGTGLDETAISFVVISFETDYERAPYPIVLQKGKSYNMNTLPVLADQEDCFFNGWLMNGQQITGGQYIINQGTVLQANWTPFKSVSFNIPGYSGSEQKEPITKIKDGTILTSEQLSFAQDENLVFKGWYTDSALQNPYDVNTPITQSFSLYAKTEGKKYTLHYNLTEEELKYDVIPENKKIYEYGSNFTGFFDTGLRSISWFLDPQCTIYSGGDNISYYVRCIPIENNTIELYPYIESNIYIAEIGSIGSDYYITLYNPTDISYYINQIKIVSKPLGENDHGWTLSLSDISPSTQIGINDIYTITSNSTIQYGDVVRSSIKDLFSTNGTIEIDYGNFDSRYDIFNATFLEQGNVYIRSKKYACSFNKYLNTLENQDGSPLFQKISLDQADEIPGLTFIKALEN